MAKKTIMHRIDGRGCHICTSHSGDSKGYPRIRRGREFRLNRYVFDQTYGPIPRGMCVCHTCDNPLRINPEHFFLGTIADNMKDKQRKGRSTRGEINRHAKLTEGSVMQIFRSPLSLAELGQEHGVSRRQIARIKRGQRWGWLTA